MPLSLYARDSGLADASVVLPPAVTGISAGSALGLAGITVWVFRQHVPRRGRLRPDRL